MRHISLWWTYPSSEYCSTPHGVEVSGCGWSRGNLLQVFTIFLRGLRILNITLTCDLAHMLSSSTLPCWHLAAMWGRWGLKDRGCFLSSLNITLVPLPDYVLVHLVLPRCVVVTIQLPRWKCPTHLCIHLSDLPWFMCSSWREPLVMQHYNDDSWFETTSLTAHRVSMVELCEGSLTLMLWYHLKNLTLVVLGYVEAQCVCESEGVSKKEERK